MTLAASQLGEVCFRLADPMLIKGCAIPVHGHQQLLPFAGALCGVRKNSDTDTILRHFTAVRCLLR